jgi:hypothetical protein
LSVHLLPARRLDGVRVDAMRVDPLYAPSYTLYFDARSYVLRGMDIAGGRGGQGRLVLAVTMPASAVPPHTFTPHAPPAARDLPSSAAPITSVDYTALALVSVCHTPPDALRLAMTSGDRSPLAICQATTPAMTRDALVAALAAAEKARMGIAEGVAVGKLTPVQAAQILANLHDKLAVWVTMPLTD